MRPKSIVLIARADGPKAPSDGLKAELHPLGRLTVLEAAPAPPGTDAVREMQTALLEASRRGADYALIAPPAVEAEDALALLTPLTTGNADYMEGRREPSRIRRLLGRAVSLRRERLLDGSRALNRRAMLRLGTTTRLSPAGDPAETADALGLRVSSAPVSDGPRRAETARAMHDGWSVVFGSARESLARAQHYGLSRVLTATGAFCFSAGAGLGLAAALGAVKSPMPGVGLLVAAAIMIGAAALFGWWRGAREALHDTVARLQGRRLSESRAC